MKLSYMKDPLLPSTRRRTPLPATARKLAAGPFSRAGPCREPLCRLAQEPGEHRVLAADLLDAVHREGVLDVPVALVLAGQVAVEAALDEHRDDLVVRDRV